MKEQRRNVSQLCSRARGFQFNNKNKEGIDEDFAVYGRSEKVERSEKSRNREIGKSKKKSRLKTKFNYVLDSGD